MCRCIDPGFSRRQRDAIQLRWIAFRLHRRCLRSRGWNRESNNNAISRTGSRFHSRRRKRRSSSKCVRTYIWLGSKSVTSRITSTIVRIQRPTQFKSQGRRFQARWNCLQHASFQTILLLPTIFYYQQRACRPLPNTRQRRDSPMSQQVRSPFRKPVAATSVESFVRPVLCRKK